MRAIFILGLVLGASLRGGESPLTEMVARAKENLSKRLASCKAEERRGAVQLDGAMRVASVASTLVTKTMGELARIRMLIEHAGAMLAKLRETSPKEIVSCEETRQLKAAQHEIAANDGNVADALVKSIECQNFQKPSLLVCGDELVLPNHTSLLQAFGPDAQAAVAKLGVRELPPATGKCCTAPEARCRNLLDGIAQLRGLLRDRADSIKTVQSEHAQGCTERTTKAVAEAQMFRSMESMLQEKLTFALRQYNTAEAQASNRQRDLDGVQKLVSGWKQECDKDVADFEFKVEQLKRARTRGEGLVRDCEVSEWREGPCSADCGGGVKNVTRVVVSPAVGRFAGHACPKLEREEKCNEKPCPTDCEMTEWGQWSQCTSTCGGGTQMRNRHIQKPAQGGIVCGGPSQVQLCNVDACDVNCVLSEWTAWSPCSQRCAGGAQRRGKEVVTPPIGAGECAPDDDMTRLEFQACPITPCSDSPTPDFTAGFTQCDGVEQDLVILLDGSGSVTAEMFEEEKKLAHQVLGYLPAGPGAFRTAVLTFAATTEVVSGLSEDGLQTKRALKQAERLPLKQAGSDLAEALGAVGRLLAGRESAARPATVFLLTDAPAASPSNRLKEASRSLRRQGVRITAAVGRMQGLGAVSPPLYANQILGTSFAAVDSGEVARMICPPVPSAVV